MNRLKLDATRSATITSARTRSAVWVWAQNMIGRAMRQMHSGIWQSLTRNRRLIPGGLGDRHPHASAPTGRTELSFAPAAVACRVQLHWRLGQGADHGPHGARRGGLG